MKVIKYALPVVILIAAFAAMKGMSRFKKEAQRRPVHPVVKKVRVTESRFGDLRPVIQALGRVQAENPVDLRSEVSGEIVARGFKLKVGKYFEAGEVLLQVDDRQARLQFKTQVSDLLNALSQFLPEAKHDLPDVYEKWQRFFNSLNMDASLPELPEADQSREKLYLSRHNVYKLYFAAKGLEIQLKKYAIQMPFSGVVMEAVVRPGTVLAPSTLLGRVIDAERMEIEVSLPVKDAARIEVKAPATFKISETGETGAGTVVRKTRGLSGAEQTITAVIVVESRSRRLVVDGMMVEVRIPGALIPRAVSLPRRAVREGSEVFRVRAGELSLTSVDIAYQGMDSAYIVGGLTEGDTLVVDNLQDGVIGSRVEPVF